MGEFTPILLASAALHLYVVELVQDGFVSPSKCSSVGKFFVSLWSHQKTCPWLQKIRILVCVGPGYATAFSHADRCDISINDGDRK